MYGIVIFPGSSISSDYCHRDQLKDCFETGKKDLAPQGFFLLHVTPLPPKIFPCYHSLQGTQYLETTHKSPVETFLFHQEWIKCQRLSVLDQQFLGLIHLNQVIRWLFRRCFHTGERNRFAALLGWLLAAVLVVNRDVYTEPPVGRANTLFLAIPTCWGLWEGCQAFCLMQLLGVTATKSLGKKKKKEKEEKWIKETMKPSPRPLILNRDRMRDF